MDWEPGDGHMLGPGGGRHMWDPDGAQGPWATGDHMWGGGYPALGWLWMLLGLVVVGLIVYLVVRLVTRDRTAVAGGSAADAGVTGAAGPGVASAREVLEMRLARGEIETEDFRDRLRALGED